MDDERATLLDRKGLGDQVAELKRLAEQIAELEGVPASVVVERVMRALEDDLRGSADGRGPTGFRLSWSGGELPFASLDDLMKFAREQGIDPVTYRPFWHTHAAGVTA